MLCRYPLLAIILLGGVASSSLAADYGAWKHQGTLALLTTPDGADLAAAAREENFPALVRLNAERVRSGHAPTGQSEAARTDAPPGPPWLLTIGRVALSTEPSARTSAGEERGNGYGPR